MGDVSVEIMRTIKKSLDPKWLMNPGKIFDYSWGNVDGEDQSL